MINIENKNVSKDVIYDENNGLYYTKIGDYYYPNIAVDNTEKVTLGKYGRARLRYLKEYNKGLYTELLMTGKLTEHLKELLLELGKGFMFVGSQVRLTLEEDHFYPDLVFYNRLLKCFVIIDLKIGKVTHQDIGQMQMYVNYYDREIKQNDENKTIGILLSTNKNETVVKYTLPEDNKTIFSYEYKLHMPTEQELITAIEEEKKNFELNENI